MSTGVSTQMAIDGDGFFIVQGANQMFTRDGAFTLNDSNQLVDDNGNFVQGYTADSNGNIVRGGLQDITIPIGQTTQAQATQNVTFAGNLNSNGTLATGASILNSQPLALKTGAVSPTLDGTALMTDVASASDPTTALFNVGDVLTVGGTKGGRSLSPSTFTVTATSTMSDFSNFVNGAMGVDTTVAGPPAPGASMQTIGGNTELTLVGNTGSENEIEMTGSAIVNQNGTEPLTMVDGTDSAGDTSGATGESVHTSMVGYDSLGTPISVDVTAVLQSRNSTGTTWQFYATSVDSTNSSAVQSQSSIVGEGTLSFDSNGKLVASTGSTISIDRTGTGATTPLTMKLDFDNMTSLAGNTSTLVMTTQDGNPVGTLSSFSIGDDGTISGSFSNGETKTLGQVAIAMFNNPEGLQNQGSNDYIVGANSGVPIITSATQLGAGEIRSGSLELSNVDLSKEFINMIVASTGFSASSRVITTSDQLITDLLNSGR